jgi:hypothetical protein
METHDYETAVFELQESEDERRLRIEREGKIIAAAQAEIAAGNAIPWSQAKAKLIAKEEETQMKLRIMQRGSSSGR